MTLNISRLSKELRAAGLPSNIAVCGLDADRSNWRGPVSWHLIEQKQLRIDWLSSPKQADIDAADAIIQAHDGTPTFEEKIGSPENALIIKLTTPEWDKYTAEEQAKIDAMIAARAAAVTAPIKP